MDMVASLSRVDDPEHRPEKRARLLSEDGAERFNFNEVREFCFQLSIAGKCLTMSSRCPSGPTVGRRWA